MFWKKKSASSSSPADKSANEKSENSKDDNQMPKMGMLQRLAMKRVINMDPKEREKLMQKALSPENIAKNKDKILATIEQMKESGQLTEEQMKMAKEKLGL